MHKVRSAAVAGAFYPAQQKILTQHVLALLASGQPPADARSPKALIVPHAGYIYSGATAALAYGRLLKVRDSIRRVVLLGPVHRVAVRGLALPDADFFATALGQIEIDQQACSAIAALPQVVVSAAAHAQEHSLEVHLPFLQTVLKDFKLLPLAVGDASAAEVAEVLEAIWGGEETLIVISSDLSHFLPYAQAQEIDRQTAQQVMNFQSAITHQQACGATPVNGLLLAAQRHGLRPELLGLCNSGDSAGDKARVVGYASFAFTEPSVGELLLPIARAAIASALGLGAQAPEDASCLQEPGACFVTLTQRGQLRGCIGSLEARRSLLADVKANAVAAALQDPRFAPLTPGELALTRVEVSLLSPLQEMHFASEADALAQLRPGIDGLVFSCGRNRSTFLPQVWEQLPGAAEFMEQLKRKAGLAADFWDPAVRLQRYSVAKWQEVSPT
jgi:AmmeMemoRadiSam system protein B/AmmeMemoRadiSam system protein A